MEKRLNSNHLKIIAIIAMTIDHATDLLYPSFPAQPIPIALHIMRQILICKLFSIIRRCYACFFTESLCKICSRRKATAIAYFSNRVTCS